jgi:3-deoxy-7-phosphoheptulonate synthase
MQDFSLLRALGKADRPVLLRRGSGATAEEFLLAAEYVLMGGNGRVMLCESGIRTFGDGGLPRFEINAIPLLKQATHLPVLADPSHTATSRAALPAVVRAAVAAGADGVVVAVHAEGAHPGTNTIGPGRLRKLRSEVDVVAEALGRHTGSPLTVPTLS